MSKLFFDFYGKLPFRGKLTIEPLVHLAVRSKHPDQFIAAHKAFSWQIKRLHLAHGSQVLLGLGFLAQDIRGIQQGLQEKDSRKVGQKTVEALVTSVYIAGNAAAIPHQVALFKRVDTSVQTKLLKFKNSPQLFASAKRIEPSVFSRAQHLRLNAVTGISMALFYLAAALQ
jgi:hypothetical protein